MNRIITPDATQKIFLNELLKSHNHLGYSAVQWFSWFLDDCLAGFGKRLETPWSEEQTSHLFNLGGSYAEAVINNAYQDILGSVYQELSSNYGKKQLAQYFTPYCVASAMSKMIYSSDIFEKKDIVRVAEPAAGSGVMMLAFISNLVDENPDHLKKLSLTCIDLDLFCVKMTTLQVLANNLIHAPKIGELITLHGSSLGDPKNLSVFLHLSTPEFQSAVIAEEEAERVVSSLSVVEPEAQVEEEVVFIQPKKQLSIFDFFEVAG